MKKKKIGLIGCGTIGSFIAKKIIDWPKLELVAISDSDITKARCLAESLSIPPQILPNEKLVSAVDIVVEAAAKEVVPALLSEVIRQGKDVLIMSVGGMLGLSQEQWQVLENYQGHLYLPTGAIAGIDAVKAASWGRLDSVTLISRKPPAGLSGAPYLIQNGLDVSCLNKPQVVFEGSAQEAVAGFPKNVNVAAALSLAGLGAQKTKVIIIADPGIKNNIHEIELVGDFGKIITRTENHPAPGNPKTSYLAALSAVATLDRIISPIQLGS